MAYEVIRFPYGGAIDADGHVLEPAWPWEEYLGAARRPRAIRIRVDPVLDHVGAGCFVWATDYPLLYGI